jgi:hypothetical protein
MAAGGTAQLLWHTQTTEDGNDNDALYFPLAAYC